MIFDLCQLTAVETGQERVLVAVTHLNSGQTPLSLAIARGLWLDWTIVCVSDAMHTNMQDTCT